MSFEGDEIGIDLVEQLLKSSAPKRHLIVDAYSQCVLSDHLAVGPLLWFNSKLQREKRETQRQLQRLRDHGVCVTFSNPLGWLLHRYPARNHKKMAVIDDHISYLGGLNFSAHNFAWQDMMLRCESSELNAHCKEDMTETLNGKHGNRMVHMGEDDLYFLDAQNSIPLYQKIWQKIHLAKNSIEVISPYITEPWLSHLETATQRGVHVRLFTPRQNNKPILSHYHAYRLHQSQIELWQRLGMSHLKAMLIDNTTLIAGSSNFDCISYAGEQEVLLISQNKSLIENFNLSVLQQELTHSRKVDSKLAWPWQGYLAQGLLQLASSYTRWIARRS